MPTAPLDLARLCNDLRLVALDSPASAVEPELVSAQLADGLRDLGLPVPEHNQWDGLVKNFGPPDWTRLQLIARVLRESEAAAPLREALQALPEEAAMALIGFCDSDARLLSQDLLLKSPFRIEELARKWAQALGTPIAGETADESRTRRERLDYGAVLKNLEAAEKDRVARMAKLKAIEEQRRREEQEAYQRAGRE